MIHQLPLWISLAVSPASAADPTYYDNVVIVLDASGSMTQTFQGTTKSRWAAATEALDVVVGALPDTTQIGLVVFSAKGGSSDWVHPLGPKDEAKLSGAFDSLRPHGGTPLGEYIKVGADRLLEARDAQHGYGTYTLLVVTDGRAGDPKLVDRFSADLLGRGLSLDVIGVAMKEDHTLKQVAHSYRRADDPDTLIKAVQDVFAEVSIGGDDQVGADAFEVTDGLPDLFAMALIEELAANRNHPIGTAPKPPPSPDPATPSEPAPPPPPVKAPDSPACATVTLFTVGGPLVGLMAAARRRR